MASGRAQIRKGVVLSPEGESIKVNSETIIPTRYVETGNDVSYKSQTYPGLPTL